MTYYIHEPLKVVTPERVAAMTKEAKRIVIFTINNHVEAFEGVKLDLKMLKHVALHVEFRRWDTIMYTYSIDFLLAILNYFEHHQSFEICQTIVNFIKWYNQELKQSLPTHSRFNT